MLEKSLRDQSFLRLVLSNPVAKTESPVSKVTVRPISVKGETQYQWTARHQSQELHENLSAEHLIDRVNSTFGRELTDAHLFSTDADISVRWHLGQPLKVKRKPPSQPLKLVADHNQTKQYLIPVGVPCPFLTEIGVMLPDGQVRPSMYHKFRQINRYLEFVEDLIPNLPSTGMLNVVDFGCGKSYLTFALHYLLTQIHHRDVSIIGLDLKQAVIDDCARIAKKLGCHGLQFEVGRIENFHPTSQVHLAVSLHACDTATDDALAAAIGWKCDAILAVPCCQHEIFQKLPVQPMAGLTRFGILKERFASLVTDALRAQLLELNGYRTQVLEFIETEHTPKNVLLRAIRRSDSSPIDLTQRRFEYDQLKNSLELTDWHLERVMSCSGDVDS